MRKSRFSEEQIIGILKEHAAGEPAGTVCRRHGISQQTLSRWQARYDGLEANELRRLKALEEDNARLKPSRRRQHARIPKPSRTSSEKTGEARPAAGRRGLHAGAVRVLPASAARERRKAL